MGLHQTRKVLNSKGIQKQNKNPTEWENIFADTFDKGLISKIYKEVLYKSFFIQKLLYTKTRSFYKTQQQKNNTIKKMGKGPE